MAAQNTPAPKDQEKAPERAQDRDRAPQPYVENTDHVPSPFFQNGTVSTSDTAGANNNNVAAVSPVFEEGRLNALLTAERAIDPEDDTPAELVVLPEGQITVSNTAKTADEGRDEIRRALDKARPSE